MDKNIKDKLIDDAKNNMPDMWDKIESKLENKKKRNSKKLVAIAAAFFVVIVVWGVGSRIGNVIEVKNVENTKNEMMEIVMLPDLNLSDSLANKVSIEGIYETSYADREYDVNINSESIVYGKVTKVYSYVENGEDIVSNITIEVTKDYRNVINKGENILLGNKGGELSYEEYINQADDSIVKKRGYDTIEEKNTKFIQLCDGVPQYRVGEYVLVYLNQVNKEIVYAPKDDKYYAPPIFDYSAIKKLYVNPITKEVFEYIYDYENSKLIKENVSTLDNLENLYK